MPLSDQQIDRYSRQIILPEVGARGQQRLLAAACRVIGDGPLAATAARYLAGAGIGDLTLVGGTAHELAGELARLNPDVHLSSHASVAHYLSMRIDAPDSGRRRGAQLLAADVSPSDLDALVSGRGASRLIAAATTPRGGWLHVMDASGGCAACAARGAAAPGGSAAVAPPISAAVIGATAALDMLKHALGIGALGCDVWLSFNADRMLLEPRPLTTAADCARCG